MKHLFQIVGLETVHVSKYWQYLEFGYLIQMAIKLNFFGASFLDKLIPKFLKKLPLPYYASQTTIVGKLK